MGNVLNTTTWLSQNPETKHRFKMSSFAKTSAEGDDIRFGIWKLFALRYSLIALIAKLKSRCHNAQKPSYYFHILISAIFGQYFTTTGIKYLVGLMIIASLACTEIPPIIGGPNQGNQEGEQRVLVEEFTGVYCVNCPGGSAFLQQLQELYGERLVVVSIHAGFFARQYPESQYQFKTDESEALQNLLGAPVAYPSATVNRTVFAGKSSRILGQADWASYVQESLDQEPQIALEMETQINTSRTATIDVQLTSLSTLNQPIYLTILLTEDNITDPQNTLSGVELNYVHHHVLRKILTPVSGESWTTSLAAGQNLSKSFTYTIPDDWNLENVSAVAFVHRNDGQLDVLNVVEKKVK